jgi:UDP-N-acetylglucosamine 2-epimerase (non-hydrolysing)
MNIALLYYALKIEAQAENIIVHTGQHYDMDMPNAYSMDLRLSAAHIQMWIGK